ncbi:MAG: hypothetical protein A3C30_04315 [Candidatus Levybacteria bacterium RIFCSPHIGHO2_02_FULL_40_18]|nr:MAG: hypothetical protein A2869_01645 [Candidatus Levybacteria bacterium RIFCSPHIGHO2_01_FULL_40_58]OGH26306.1 MAG: hypothetical protein A3C30_04315 [Candidatus Levybacteria bacterium RIFCSPHIGHO2_02_FULL_40_18]OGH31265.1 MAG: hypothetical protein A3E43_02570 [Candidatus Levybacteria bacterium RIFCSPHIGHO2_12_FULL_40_31]OGH40335.1 MAG: hypothetical protein A2894_05280 [Candidatus Levybacteria bacterium RIFCSPLOWO2_01_FULL_40_64]OGH49237.1 MAG: hypothetical protein A3I54_01160 [Candidatus Lev
MKRGITLIEVIIVIGILMTLAGMASISFVPFRSGSILGTAITTLISDLSSQQIKVMAGDTEGRSTNDNYGIYFGTNSYTLFHGDNFDPNDPSNFTINLNEDLQIQSTFPSSQIIFLIKSGEVTSFSETQNSITLEDTVAQDSKTININRYGVVTSLN